MLALPACFQSFGDKVEGYCIKRAGEAERNVFFEGRIRKVDTAGELFEMFVAANLRPKEQLRLQPQRQMHWSANHAPLAVAGPVQSLCKCCMVLFHVNVGSTCLTASSCEPGVWSHFEALQSCKVFV